MLDPSFSDFFDLGKNTALNYGMWAALSGAAAFTVYDLYRVFRPSQKTTERILVQLRQISSDETKSPEQKYLDMVITFRVVGRLSNNQEFDRLSNQIRADLDAIIDQEIRTALPQETTHRKYGMFEGGDVRLLSPTYQRLSHHLLLLLS